MDKKLQFFMSTTGADGKEVEFALDENNNLYIDKKRVITQEVVKLRWVELFALCITATSVVVQAIFAALTYLRP